MMTRFLLLLLFGSPALAAGLPATGKIGEVRISLEALPRWPVGEAVTITFSGSGTATITRTKLPCDPCNPRIETIEVTREEVLNLLNSALDSGFVELNDLYDATRSYTLDPNGNIQLGQTTTTDEDREIMTVTIGSWSKRVVNDGEAPIVFHHVAAAIRAAADRARAARR